MDTLLIKLLNILIPSLSVILAVLLVYVFVRKKKTLTIPSKCFLLFLLGFIIYAFLLGVRSSTTDTVLATFISKTGYALSTVTGLSLFLTAYTLKGLNKSEMNKLGFLFLPVVLVFLFLFLPDSVQLERNAIDWTINLNPIFSIIYVTSLMIFSFLSMYYFRKIFKGIEVKKYKKKIRYIYLSVLSLIISYGVVFMVFYLKPIMPLTIALIPFIINISLMFLAFVA